MARLLYRLGAFAYAARRLVLATWLAVLVDIEGHELARRHGVPRVKDPAAARPLHVQHR
ncbi:MAG TPA: hypothetical protein VFD90_03705 [Gaiellales bacterium]|jgi:hypothetical protein|nr:hypothetical protein [Gaiellales bacterium]